MKLTKNIWKDKIEEWASYHKEDGGQMKIQFKLEEIIKWIRSHLEEKLNKRRKMYKPSEMEDEKMKPKATKVKANY